MHPKKGRNMKSLPFLHEPMLLKLVFAAIYDLQSHHSDAQALSEDHQYLF
jgi:hypothetical protein